ncbi:UNKNOWN [Stylonychia lemnae]|uniref:Uncharacterized protein n=1 Tax=Stylonychia lemnae TaxID=5949 RepID=A0A078B243_STYLE|nr:UNKNOWN [Stylonychia lemnae]|eukprot:CDW88564.1 UNKNOWN [Stylonychia lemnae]
MILRTRQNAHKNQRFRIKTSFLQTEVILKKKASQIQNCKQNFENKDSQFNEEVEKDEDEEMLDDFIASDENINDLVINYSENKVSQNKEEGRHLGEITVANKSNLMSQIQNLQSQIEAFKQINFSYSEKNREYSIPQNKKRIKDIFKKWQRYTIIRNLEKKLKLGTKDLKKYLHSWDGKESEKIAPINAFPGLNPYQYISGSYNFAKY